MIKKGVELHCTQTFINHIRSKNAGLCLFEKGKPIKVVRVQNGYGLVEIKQGSVSVVIPIALALKMEWVNSLDE